MNYETSLLEAIPSLDKLYTNHGAYTTMVTTVLNSKLFPLRDHNYGVNFPITSDTLVTAESFLERGKHQCPGRGVSFDLKA